MQSVVGKYRGELDARVQSRHEPTWPNGCHIAEVEVDPGTGEIEVISYLACDDT